MEKLTRALHPSEVAAPSCQLGSNPDYWAAPPLIIAKGGNVCLFARPEVQRFNTGGKDKKRENTWFEYPTGNNFYRVFNFKGIIQKVSNVKDFSRITVKKTSVGRL
ncbi:hypothetical protein GGTG_01663 [Gaeumannomyces tritici R3-111a-1]|uniref:Uncharacterized protein n=1 Tax=Gaeumannomyces tritici (strain R3-111a-1) TaxID=644352 RepID=J3NK82_GAET3|nr:hypothetical protein GGTG_01663 [Gaeumannomyces tritici R3-111a-1]EJT81686.1 hypothetical protein GGTG_01663 [Gaeumannomyces tritici R3-111a-1]